MQFIVKEQTIFLEHPPVCAVPSTSCTADWEVPYMLPENTVCSTNSPASTNLKAKPFYTVAVFITLSVV